MTFPGRAAMTVAVVLLPRVASACPVCFGAADGPLLRGSNMGILALLVVTVAMLGVFGAFFRSLARRATRVRHADDSNRLSAPEANLPQTGGAR